MTEQVTGREPYTPVRIKKVSVTERADFRKCRRRWFLSDVWRLEGPNAAMYFQFGEAMHKALQVYHTALEDQATEGMLTFEAIWAEFTAKAMDNLGFLWDYSEPEWTAHRKLGVAMLTGYFRQDAKSGFDFPAVGRTLYTERRFTVKIPGTNGKLTGKLDLVTEDRAKDIIGWDHKNLASQHSSAQLDLDDQLTGYAWLYYGATGDRLDHVAYNVLLKKLPVSEKTGKPTTSTLFIRDITTRSDAQLEQFEGYLIQEWKDMRRVALHPEQAYPNPSPFNCPKCPVRAICVSMMNGEDVEYVVKSGYRIGEERD